MRRVILVGLAVVAGAILPAAGSARTAGTTISISAQTTNSPIGGLVWATYGTTAQISGNTGDGLAGDTVELQQSVFPFKAGFAEVGQTQTGTGGSYSFTTPKPSLATQYRVVLASDPTSESSVVTVYVSAAWINRSKGTCPGGLTCRRHFASDIVYPAKVARRRGAKRAYYYFGVHYGSQSVPPARVRLVQTGRQRHLHANRYRVGFTVTFSTARAYYYYWEICTKDTEARDGLGLPGHHHCGARAISYSAIQQGYIG